MRQGALAVAAAVLGMLLTGCALAPPAPTATVVVPPGWSGVSPDPSALPPSADWWRGFGSEELTRLIDAALRHNRELQATRSRLAQARARSQIAGAERSPQIDAGLGVAREREAGARSTSVWSADFTARYEVDLAGGRQRAIDAAGERVRAGAFALEAARLSVQAEVAVRYFTVLSLRERIALAERSLANAQSVLALLQRQQRSGATSGLEVLRQQAQVATVQASLPPLQRQLQQTIDALAVLTGQPPQSLTVGEARLDALGPPSVGAGLPSTLLQRRPDIRQAEAELAAAQADMAAARAALYPSLSLTAEGGARSAGLATLLRSGSLAWSVGAGLVATVFDGGRRQGAADLELARRDERLALYEQAILGALRDVEDSLVDVMRGAEQMTIQQQAIEHARGALRLAELRFRNGAVDFSTVLDAQRVLLAAEDGLQTATLARHVAAVGLFRSLGGGWSGQITDQLSQVSALR